MFKDKELRNTLTFALLHGNGSIKDWVYKARSFFNNRTDEEILFRLKCVETKLDQVLEFLDVEEVIVAATPKQVKFVKRPEF